MPEQPIPEEVRAAAGETARELPLDEKKAAAAAEWREAIERIGLGKSETFSRALKQMEGMDHGPNHREGDPAVHTQLVLHELRRALQTAEHGLSESDVELLRLAVPLHDIGKADTQKFDVVSQKQNEMVGADASQIEEARAWKNQLLAELSGKTPEELAGLSKSQLAKVEAEYADTLQEKIKHLLPSVSESVKRAMAANFRGHDDKSAAMLPTILAEAGIDFSPGQRADAEFVVKNHMLLLNPGDVRLQKFKELFVNPDGSVDQRKIDLLRMHTRADDAASVRPGETAETKRAFGASMDAALANLGQELRKEKEAEQKKREAAEFERQVFGGTMADYVMAKGVPQGPEFGKAMGKLKGAMAKLRQDNPDISPEALKAALDKIE